MPTLKLPSLGRRGATRHGTHVVRTERSRAWSLHQIALVGLATIGSALFVIALRGAAAHGVDAAVWIMLIGPLLLIRVVDSAWPLAYWAVLLYLWTQATDTGSFSWWSVLAGTGGALSHAATSLAASAPPAAEFPRATQRAWLGRTLLAVAAAVATAGAAHVLAGHTGGLGPAAYVVGLLGVAALLWVTRSNPPATPD